MKKIIGLLLLLIALNVQAQFPTYPTVKQSLGSKSTEVYSKGIFRADSGYVQSVFPDTIEANRGYIKNIAGITIRIVDTVYFRNAATSKWIAVYSVLNSTSTPNLQQVTDVGSTTTNSIEVDGLTVNGPALFRSDTKLGETGAGIAATFNSTGNAEGGILLTNNITTSQSQLEFPDASGTIPVTVNGVAANTSGEITVPVGTGTVTGTGTTNIMSKWTSSTAIGNSSVTDDGTTVTQTIKNLFTANGALSAPAITGNGTWITGGSATTTKPYLLIEPSGTTSTGWSTAGTGLGVNAVTGFAGNIIDGQLAGVNKFSVDYTGRISCTAELIAGGYVKSSLATGLAFYAPFGGIYAGGVVNNYFAGNVGIGTSAPGYPLHIRNAGGLANSLVVEATSSGSYGALASKNDAGTMGFFGVYGSGHAHANDLFFYNYGASAGDINFYTGNVGPASDFVATFKIGGQVGIGTTSPNASSILDVSSTTKGILIPRMTNTQMNAISSPDTSLQVFNTTNNAYYYYDGSAWRTMSNIYIADGTLTGDRTLSGGTNSLRFTGLDSFTVSTDVGAFNTTMYLDGQYGLTLEYEGANAFRIDNGSGIPTAILYGNLLFEGVLGDKNIGGGTGSSSNPTNIFMNGKLNITTGANKSAGTATLVAGTVTVSTTSVATASLIFVVYDTPAGTLAAGLSAPAAGITNGTSFVINSLTTAGVVNTLDNSSIRWWIIN